MDFNDYIGLPFAENNDGGVDCWGLVRKIYDEKLAIRLPDYRNIYDKTSEREKIDAFIEHHRREWHKVEPHKRQIYDLVLIKIGGFACHLGVYIGGGEFIHCVKSKQGVVVDRVNSKKWNNRIEGYYRYGNLTSV